MALLMQQQASWRAFKPFQSSRVRRHHLRSPKAINEAGADGIVFGKPMAPKELYESIAKEARESFLAQVGTQSGHQGDAVLGALHFASEDDAIKTRTHIALPVSSFSTRLDNVVAEVRGMMPPGLSDTDQLAFVTNHLYNTWGLKVSKRMEDGLYSPYRVYMHNVLAQRCGTQAACATVLHSLLDRLKAQGVITWTAHVGLPADFAAEPVARLASVPSAAAGDSSTDAVRWMNSQELITELLDQLKRAYWSWDFPLGAVSGFDACARSLLGDAGRAGRVNAAVGVMQSRGRPFGNVELAMLASERLCLTTRVMARDSWTHQLQVRDYAVQLMHVGKSRDGVQLLSGYLAWLEQDNSRAEAAVACTALCRALLLEQQRQQLEDTLGRSDASSALDIIDPDRDA